MSIFGKTLSPLLSNYIRQRRYTLALPYVGEAVLDIGCGSSAIAALLPSLRHYVGLDSHAALLKQARTTYPQHTFYLIDIEHEPLPAAVLNQTFDTVILTALLEHLANPQLILQQVADLLKPTGQVIATTPTPLGHRVHRLGAAMGLFYREAVEDHKSILDKVLLQALCSQAGLKMTVYKQFEFGCNQLVVAQPVTTT